jgi:hypothetical protein
MLVSRLWRITERFSASIFYLKESKQIQLPYDVRRHAPVAHDVSSKADHYVMKRMAMQVLLTMSESLIYGNFKLTRDASTLSTDGPYPSMQLLISCSHRERLPHDLEREVEIA